MANFLEWISHVSDFFGILGAFFALMAWLSARIITRKLRERFKESEVVNKDYPGLYEFHKGVKSDKPFAIAISLSNRIPSIKADVVTFLKENKWTMPIVEINRNKEITHEDLDSYIKELLEKRWDLDIQGATEIHLFINAPVQAATLAGAMFEHWKPVKLYQRNNNTCKYEYWGPLIK